MILDIQKAKQKNGQKIEFAIDVKLRDDFVSDYGYSFVKPATVKGYMVYEYETLNIFSEALVQMNLLCDKCGVEFVKEIKFDLNETFVVNPTDMSRYPLGQTFVDISKPLLDNLVFNMPSRILCKENCKGLCGICGKNLNTSKCNCQALDLSEDDNPFAKLKNLK